MDTIIIMETNIDDLSPEVHGYLMQKLLGAGALDVSFTPTFMKKNRPAVKVTILATVAKATELAELLFTESTSIGLRYWPVSRLKCQREVVKVATTWGEVRVKVSYLGERQVNAAPEYEDCRKLAEENKVPLKAVYNAALSSLDRIEI